MGINQAVLAEEENEVSLLDSSPPAGFTHKIALGRHVVLVPLEATLERNCAVSGWS